jgi:5'-nucleotidase
MHILITNDDGISSSALHALAKQLSEHHAVTVVAPAGEQSGVSHAFSYRKNIFVKQYDDYGYPCYSVSGTPADCVKFAFFELCRETAIDLVVSGINDGHNTGIGCFYSGTVGGAREGALLGIPSIAVSSVNHQEKNVQAGVAWVKQALAKNLFNNLTPDALWNVNIPDLEKSDIVGVRFCTMSRIMYHDDYILESDGQIKEYSFKGYRPQDKFYPGSDDYLVNRGYITIVPLRTDQSDHKFLEQNIEL